MGFQLLAALGLGAWVGDYIDTSMQNSTPWATLGCLLFMLGAVLYLLIKQLNQDT